MDLPSVRTTVKDDSRGITYIVLAYRTVTRDEAVFAIRTYLAQHKRKPKSGSTITIVTTIGAS